MKLFSKLLLAPALVGLATPLAATAADLGAGSSTSAINSYMNQQDLDRMRAMDAQSQVTSITQFSDVQPTEWAYQALSNLVDKYGCVAGYPDGTFRGKKPLTRWEAAALLNACLDRVTEITDELQRLMKEFQKELAILKGRVDKLDAKVGKLEAQQFSTTTKLRGEVTYFIGGVNYNGDGYSNRLGGFSSNTATGLGARPFVPATQNAFTFSYDARLIFNTSFTGKDLLFTRLRTGNTNANAFGGANTTGNPFNLTALDRSYNPAAGPNAVEIDRLYYRFPSGKEWTFVVGPLARNTEFLAITPSAYTQRGDSILDFFTTWGAPGTYNKATGGAVAAIWRQNVKRGQGAFAASASYVAQNAAIGTPGSTAAATQGGVFTDSARGNILTQIGYVAPQWAITGAWRYGQEGTNNRRGTQFTTGSALAAAPAGVDSSAFSNGFALNAYWQPKKGGTIVPSISVGWGINALTQANLVRNQIPAVNSPSNIGTSQSWYTGLQWSDAFAKGNAAGFAVGQATFATSLLNGRTPQDGNYVWEWWYKFQVTDNISVTPAIFYLSRPNGQLTVPNTSVNTLGYLVQTTFRF